MSESDLEGQKTKDLSGVDAQSESSAPAADAALAEESGEVKASQETEAGEPAAPAAIEAEGQSAAEEEPAEEAEAEAEEASEIESPREEGAGEPAAPAVVEVEGVAAAEERKPTEEEAEAVVEPDEAEQPVKEEEPDDGRAWYVVHCYSGYENKVRHNLEQRIESMGMKGKIFDVVVPTEEEIEVKEGKRRTIERRVFPGYILVQMIMDEDSWYVVRNTPGVTGFVGMGNEPTPLRPEEVGQIVRRMEAQAPRVKVTYKVSQKVRIIDGPFNDFIGTVEHIDMERAKVRVMVSFFGRETPVELDFLQVEKA
jgi:transcriptional antiterminator NusG